MSKVVVGIWSVSVYNSEWAHQTMRAKLKAFSLAMQELMSARIRLGIQSTRDLSAIFVAPEYMFAYPDSENPFHLSSDDHKEFRRYFDNYYAAGTLIVPGSIAHRKVLTKLKQKKHSERFQDHLKRLKSPWSDWYTQSIIKDQQKEISRAGELLTSVGLGPKIFYARNTAYGYFHRRRVLKYHKRTAVSDQIDKNIIFVPGVDPNGCVIRDTSFSLELCRDASQGYMANIIPGKFDVQLVLSATVSRTEIQKKFKRYLIHGCNIPKESGVYTNNGEWLKPRFSKKLYGYPMDFYAIDL